MKHIRNSFIAIFLAVSGFAFPLIAEPNFELWNKHNDPLYYSISNSAEEASHKKFEELRPGKWTQAKTIDTSKPTIIAIKLGKMPVAGDRIDTYTIKPNKKIIIRVGLPAEKEKFKETLKSLFGKTSIEANGYIFGPQTGPLLGFKAAEGILPFDWGKTVNERGLALKGNLTKEDITKGSMIYLPK
jgi:hypothetical protein